MEQKNEVTTYTTSDGKTMQIAELNAFHLVNGLLKQTRILVMSDELSGYKEDVSEELFEALKKEVLRRLLPVKG